MALETPLVVRWRGPVRFENVAQGPEEDPELTPCNRERLAMAARLLRVLRSFPSDTDLFDTMVTLTENDQVKCFASLEVPVVRVPLLHAMDQHVYRGIGHASLKGGSTFKKRFEDIFYHVTGFSPRLSMRQLDENDEQVRRTRHMETAVSIKVFNLVQPFAMTSTTAKTMQLQLDPGVLSGGVGTLGPFRVTTTAAENAAESGPSGTKSWTLLVVVGVESATPIVVNSWTVRENDKKPPVTATARAKALEKARDLTSVPFSSPMLPGYNRATFENGVWKVTSAGSKPSIPWSWSSPVIIPLEYMEFAATMRTDDPITNPNGRVLPDLTDDEAMIAFLREKTEVRGAIWDRLDTALVEIVLQLGELAESANINRRVMQVRFLSMLRQQYEVCTAH